MNYSSISAREHKLLEEVEKRGLITFGPLDAANILSIGRAVAHNVLSRMECKGDITRIERGKYVSSGLFSGLDIYELAPHIFEPSYLSMWSGMHYYGYTTQVSAEVFLVTVTARKGLNLWRRNVRYVAVKPRMFFGYTKNGRVVVAEPEKLLLDCLSFPQYCGGFGEILAAARRANVDGDKVSDYAVMIGSPTLCSRAGYLMESAGIQFDEKKLLSMISKSFVWLDPSTPVNRFNSIRKWKVYDNAGVLASTNGLQPKDQGMIE